MIARNLAVCLMCLLLTPAVLEARQEPVETPAVTKLDAAPKQSVFDDATRQKPIELASAEAAKAYFEGDALDALNKQVDWKKQTVLVFAWKGSGGDKMSTDVIEGEDKRLVVQFIFTAGLTRDLRPHIYVYAVNNDLKWQVK